MIGGDSVSLANQVLNTNFGGGSHLAFCDEAFQHFEGSHWVELPETQLGGTILNSGLATATGRHRSSTTARETIALFKMMCARDPFATTLVEPPPVINVANGELWLAEDGSAELRPHSPKSGQRACLHIDYDPSATCPNFDSALVEIFSRSGDPTGLAAFWNEVVGYGLQPARPDARIVVCFGGGGDGKSSLADLLVTLLGPKLVAAMPIGSLAGNRFGTGYLADKRLLLDDDVAAGEILPDGILKTISERKVITAERKFRDPLTFQILALPMLLCNSVPHLRDTSNGFRRRLTVIPFNRQFTPQEADRRLFERIKAAELPGVLNRALDGLQRVVQRGWKLTPPTVVVRATEDWWSKATGLSSSPEIAAPSTNVPPFANRAPARARFESSDSTAEGEAFGRSGFVVHIEGARTYSVSVQSSGLKVEVHTAAGRALRP